MAESMYSYIMFSELTREEIEDLISMLTKYLEEEK